jgi:putative transcriptional regulator
MRGTKLKKLRQKRGFTQEGMGQVLGITKDYVYMIENGRRNPSFALAKRIADLYKVTVDELFF